MVSSAHMWCPHTTTQVVSCAPKQAQALEQGIDMFDTMRDNGRQGPLQGFHASNARDMRPTTTRLQWQVGPQCAHVASIARLLQMLRTDPT